MIVPLDGMACQQAEVTAFDKLTMGHLEASQLQIDAAWNRCYEDRKV